jgi:hypothetical protein
MPISGMAYLLPRLHLAIKPIVDHTAQVAVRELGHCFAGWRAQAAVEAIIFSSSIAVHS